MDALFVCLGKEFSDVEFTFMNINPTHTVNYSKNGNEGNIITLTITVYNSIHNQVGRKIIKFVNDKYKITPAKKLDHVTPEELDSAFLLSKNALLEEIYKDYREKFGKINDKLQNLLKYTQVEE